MKEFWKNNAVKNYLVSNIFDIDEIVMRYGGCPDDEDYKITRSYYCDEFINIDEGYKTSDASKDDYEKYLQNEDDYYDFSYRTELNYNDFLDKFWFDTFEQTLYEFIEPDEQLDFIKHVEETFFTLKFEGQAKLFLRKIVKTLSSWSAHINYLQDSDFHKTNEIQEKVINLYSGSYLNTKKRIIKQYKFIYPDIENDFNPKGTSINTKLSRNDILEKLVGANKNLDKFYEYEKKLKTQKYLSENHEWIKKPADLVRFYLYCIKQKVFNNYFIEDMRGIDYLRQLFNYHEGKTIDTKTKIQLQNVKSKKFQFNFLDLN